MVHQMKTLWSKHGTDFWKCCAFSGTLCKEFSLFIFFPLSLSSPSLFPHQTSASADDALKESLCGLHTKQRKAALKASGQRKSSGVSNMLLNMHI